MSSSPLFCPVCGAANSTQATHCFACNHDLSDIQSVISISSPLLKQRYRTIATLGQGGMGAVYKAEDTELGNRLVAIKEMSQKGLNQQEANEAVDGFKREALLLAGLMHPNLPRIYDHFAESGRWYLVMDFIEGETLETYLSRHPTGKLPIQDALAIGIQLCTVLDYLHTRKPPIIFRDLKPSNILRTPDGQLYLIDFGIARHFKPGQAKDTMAFGSPGYAAPEQYGRTQTTPATDIYSLGAMLHEMLTGEDPSLNPFTFAPLTMGPPELQTLLDQMLDMNPTRRPTSALMVKQELQHIASMSPSALQASLAQGQSSAGWLSGQSTTKISRGHLFTTYVRHIDWVSSLAWSPGSTYIASGSYDRTVQIWDPASGDMYFLYNGHIHRWGAGRVHAVSWSPDGHTIVSGSDDKSVQLIDASTGKWIVSYLQHSSPVLAVAWSPIQRFIASAAGSITHIWDSNTCKTLVDYSGHKDVVQCLAWSPDGRFLATGSRDKTVLVCDTNDWQANLIDRISHRGSPGSWSIAHYKGHADIVQALAWSPDGTRIASASNDKTVQIWDAMTGKLILVYEEHTDPVKAVVWSPDGLHIASAGIDAEVRIWDALTGNTTFIYDKHQARIYSLAWSPDGTRIASGDAHNAVHVWQAT